MKRVALVASLALLAAGAVQAAPVQTSPTREQVALAALPQAQLGKLAARLPIELPSGFTDNARAADDSFDPDDTARSVTQLGRLFGYMLLYGDPTLRAIKIGEGLVDLGSSIDVFRSPQHARAYAAKALADLTKVRGQNLDGVVLEQHERFPVTRIGHQAVGLRLRIRLGDRVLHGTYIDFRYGRILGEAVVTRADDENVDAIVLGLARKLDRRLRGVLAGTVRGRPAKLPRAAKPGRPPGAPDLSAMALNASDAPTGARVAAERYQDNESAVASYFRDFAFGQAAVKTGLLAIRSAADLLRSGGEASGHLFLLRSVFTVPDAARTVAKAFGDGAKLKTSNPRVDEVLEDAGLGDDSFAAAVSFDTQLGRLRIVILYFRTDRVIGSLVVTGVPKALNARGVLPLGRGVATAIEKALGKQIVA